MAGNKLIGFQELQSADEFGGLSGIVGLPGSGVEGSYKRKVLDNPAPMLAGLFPGWFSL